MGLGKAIMWVIIIAIGLFFLFAILGAIINFLLGFGGFLLKVIGYG